MSADHFLYAEDPDKFADMLVEFSSEYGHAAERDLFIVRAVLQWVHISIICEMIITIYIKQCNNSQNFVIKTCRKIVYFENVY